MKPTPEVYGLASKIISLAGIIVFAIGLILGNNIPLFWMGGLMILTGTFFYWKGKAKTEA